jgi:predicted dinucleotide-binding enzyme
MRIGIVGAGMIGSSVAKLWVDAGHHMRLASRHPENLLTLIEKLGSRVSVGTPAEAAAFGDLVMLTVPLKAIPDLARDLAPHVEGKIVVDTGNADENRDGPAAREATRHPDGSAGWAAAMFPKARWVKGFNTVHFQALDSEAHRDAERIGIPLASDDRDAMNVVAELVADAGFDPVPVGMLRRGKEFEPGTPPYYTGMSGAALRAVWP